MNRKQMIRSAMPLRPAATDLAPASPALRLTPYTWAKVLRLRDLGPTEVGGFGISSPRDLLLLEDVALPCQRCTDVTVKFDDESVACFFNDQVDQGRRPEQFARIWLHTHPGHCAWPSTTDEETFARCFGAADWAVMLIIARGGEVFARLRLRTGPGVELMLPVAVDFGQSFPAAAHEVWDEEYRRSVRAEQSPVPPLPTASVWDWPALKSELEGSPPSESTDRHSVDQESLCEQFF